MKRVTPVGLGNVFITCARDLEHTEYDRTRGKASLSPPADAKCLSKEQERLPAQLTGYKPPESAFPRRTTSGLTFS